MGDLIKGRPVADNIKQNLKVEIERLKVKGVLPKLKIIRVGTKPDDLSYERGTLKTMEQLDIKAEVAELPEDVSQQAFIKVVQDANKDKTVHGVLIFRPLPPQLDENAVRQALAPEKDVDCLTSTNVAKVMEGDETGFAPCTPSAVMEILRYYDVNLRGKNAVVIGRSMVVGKPVGMLLLKEDATVTICHSKTTNLKQIASNADVLVCCVGKAKMITSEYVKTGAVVIDVGINVNDQGELCGDVDTDDCINRASKITPVPGGVGSVTTSILAKNVIKASQVTTNCDVSV